MNGKEAYLFVYSIADFSLRQSTRHLLGQGLDRLSVDVNYEWIEPGIRGHVDDESLNVRYYLSGFVRSHFQAFPSG